MYKVYALASIHRKYVYVGLSSNLEARIGQHNSGFERTTKPYAPYVLIYSEAVKDRHLARIREKYLKSRNGKRKLYELIVNNHPELFQYEIK